MGSEMYQRIVIRHRMIACTFVIDILKKGSMVTISIGNRDKFVVGSLSQIAGKCS